MGVVESRTSVDGGALEYSVRVERALKGSPGERVTLRSAFTSCQAHFAIGSRVGLLYNAGGEIFACTPSDPEALIAASQLPAPSGTARFLVAIDGHDAADTVLLGARGQIAGYPLQQGRVLALARCGPGGVVQAVRGADGKVGVLTSYATGVSGAVTVPLRDAVAVGCTENGRRQWVTGSDGSQVRLLSVRGGELRAQMRRPADAAAISGSRAYYVHGGDFVRMVPLTGGLLRAARSEGRFASISGRGDRVAGRLRDGRTAVLNLRSGKQITGPEDGRLTWLSDDRLLGDRAVYDTRLRRVRAISTRGTLVGVVNGAAYFADGNVLYRLAPGAKRVARFAELPGRVTSIVAAPAARAASTSWHSCEESAKAPLTT